MNNSNERPLGWTTLEESKQLVEAGLSVETADMHYWLAEGKEYVYIGKCPDSNGMPCWSLGALVHLLPLNIQIRKLYSGYPIVAYCIDQSLHSMTFAEKRETLIESCINMIILLLNNKVL